MKVTAHPLLVAVALGLLGPGALAAEATDDEQEPSVRRAPAPVATQSELVDALEDEQAPYWTKLTLVEEDEADGWVSGS